MPSPLGSFVENFGTAFAKSYAARTAAQTKERQAQATARAAKQKADNELVDKYVKDLMGAVGEVADGDQLHNFKVKSKFYKHMLGQRLIQGKSKDQHAGILKDLDLKFDYINKFVSDPTERDRLRTQLKTQFPKAPDIQIKAALRKMFKGNFEDAFKFLEGRREIREKAADKRFASQQLRQALSAPEGKRVAALIEAGRLDEAKKLAAALSSQAATQLSRGKFGQLPMQELLTGQKIATSVAQEEKARQGRTIPATIDGRTGFITEQDIRAGRTPPKFGAAQPIPTGQNIRLQRKADGSFEFSSTAAAADPAQAEARSIMAENLGFINQVTNVKNMVRRVGTPGVGMTANIAIGANLLGKQLTAFTKIPAFAQLGRGMSDFLSENADPQVLKVIKQESQKIIARSIKEFTGEGSSRISGAELDITRKATALNQSLMDAPTVIRTMNELALAKIFAQDRIAWSNSPTGKFGIQLRPGNRADQVRVVRALERHLQVSEDTAIQMMLRIRRNQQSILSRGLFDNPLFESKKK